MILSVIIPVYNCDARRLVEDIHQHVLHEPAGVEIIVGDDCSPQPQTWMSEVEGLSGVKCWRAPHNLGRAAIRNRLAGMACGQWLWFIDADTALSPSFAVSKYLDVQHQAQVLCGGIQLPPEQPPHASLRYRYEVADARRRTAVQRNKAPYQQISTCNLFVRADVFRQILFDEEIKEYGHEDTMFGLQLRKRNIPVLHIENPVVHLGLESNDIFLHKTEIALTTLHEFRDKLRGYSKVIQIADMLERLHLYAVVRRLLSCAEPFLRRNLLSDRPSLKAFAAYKLGFYLNL